MSNVMKLTGVKTLIDGGSTDVIPPTENTNQVIIQLFQSHSIAVIHGHPGHAPLNPIIRNFIIQPTLRSVQGQVLGPLL